MKCKSYEAPHYNSNLPSGIYSIMKITISIHQLFLIPDVNMFWPFRTLSFFPYSRLIHSAA